MAGTSSSPGRMYSGMDAQAREDDRRDRLLQAGLELYGTIGFHRTTISSLCSTAGITARHFYELYPTQDELLVALYQRIVEETEAAVTVAIAEATDGSTAAVSVIEVASASLFSQLLGDKRRARVVCVEAVKAQGPSSVVHVGMDRLHEVIDRVYRLLAPRIDIPPPVDPSAEVLAWAVAGAIRELLTVGLGRPEGASYEDLVRAVTVIAARAFEIPAELLATDRATTTS